MRFIKWLGGLGLMALLLSRPEMAIHGASNALASWYASVAPALFPFLALMPLLTCEEAAQAYEHLLGQEMQMLFCLPGAAAPAMAVSMVAGMPAGAIAARNTAARAGMNRGQLRRLTISFSGFSPFFLVGGIGVGMLGSMTLGWKLLQAQLLTQLTLALMLRRAWRDDVGVVISMPGGGERAPFEAVLTVGGYMALFGAIGSALESWMGRQAARVALCLLDLPSGARVISEMIMDRDLKLVLLAAICGFGGICAAAQVLGALRGCGTGVGKYLELRVLAATIEAGYMALLLKLPRSELAGIRKAAQANPFAVAGLVAALLTIPVLVKARKSIS